MLLHEWAAEMIRINEMISNTNKLKEKHQEAYLKGVVFTMVKYGITLRQLENMYGRREEIIKNEFQVESPDGIISQLCLPSPRRFKRMRAPIKYISPGGEVWSGRGHTPRWVKDIIKEGKSIEDYKV